MSTTDSISAEVYLAQRSAVLFGGPDVDELLESVALDFRLVVDLQSQVIYWNGQSFEPDVTLASWQFFATLVQKAKEQGKGVDLFDFCGRKQLSDSALRSRKKRLVDRLTACGLADLADEIVRFDHGYKLKVPPSSIYLHPNLQTQRPQGQLCISA